jgi:hypothetical protein
MSGDLADLAGAWEITARLTAGRDDREPDDGPKYLWFLCDVIVTGDEWAAWEMPFSARSGPAHGLIDVTCADLLEPWEQSGIFRVQDGILELCMAGEANEARPTAFSSTESNGHVLYVARRSNEPLPSRASGG